MPTLRLPACLKETTHGITSDSESPLDEFRSLRGESSDTLGIYTRQSEHRRSDGHGMGYEVLSILQNVSV
jgi:hypothetical protein